MCGRYSFAQLSLEVEKRFKIHVDGNTYVAKYNNAPGQKLAVIANSYPNELQFFHWGLIPAWSQDQRMAFNMINARAETLETKPAFRSAFKSKRCLIPADGFYEWKKNGRIKTPFHIRLKSQEMFAMAGLWEEWKDVEGKIKNSFTIITTESNDLMRKLHPRMPVMLPKELEKEWLKDLNPKDLKEMLLPLEGKMMEAFEVSPKINKASNEGKELTDPFSSGIQTSLFNL